MSGIAGTFTITDFKNIKFDSVDFVKVVDVDNKFDKLFIGNVKDRFISIMENGDNSFVKQAFADQINDRTA